MEIKIKIDNIDYADLAVALMPLIRGKLQEKPGAVAKILASLTTLPEGLIRKTLGALPQENKDEMAAMLINENQEKLIAMIQDYAKENGVALKISDLHVEE